LINKKGSGMKPERWQQIDQLFHSALEREPEERAAFLDQACDGDEVLRREVESLLAADAEAENATGALPAQVAAEMLATDRGLIATGQQIGHYRVLSPLGAGGMGEVYLAQDTRLGRKIALKLLPARFTQNAERVRRFEREARAASALNHPNILTIHEIGQVQTEAGGLHFIATELVEGQTLRQQMKHSRLSLFEALDVATQVSSALNAAHSTGIVHRDIKPENIMLRPDGLVEVLDFGLAKLTERHAAAVDTQAPTIAGGTTEPGVVMGTASYMSPEQARGLEVDARTDIFSLGVVIYEMMAGRAPFAGETPSDVMAAILTTEPEQLSQYSPEAPPEPERIVAKALRKDREERYQVAKDLLVDLKDLKQELELEAKLGRADRNEATTAVRSTSGAEHLLGGVKRRKRGVVVILAACIVVLAIIAYFARGGRLWSDGGGTINSIAVLPFANADPNTEYLSDGITESLINSLSQLSQLKVIARTTAFRYKGTDADPRIVGPDLKVDAVLTGRVTQQGETLLVQVDLVNAADGAQLWGERYKRKLSNIFTIQEEIARQISEKLPLILTGEKQKRIAKRYTENIEAYQLYLKGRYYAEKRTIESYQKATEHYKQALDLDPNYALAWLGLADAYYLDLPPLPAKERMPRAKAAAMKALAIDEMLGEAHTSLARIIWQYDWDLPAAEREFKRALELDPGSAFAHRIHGYYLASMGRLDESMSELRKAQQLDPLSLIINLDVGQMLYFAGQNDQAMAQFRKTQEMDPNFRYTYHRLGLGYCRMGVYPEAVANLDQADTLAKGSPRTISLLGYAYVLWGKRDEAIKKLGELKELSKRRYVTPYEMAVIYTGLGRLIKPSSGCNEPVMSVTLYLFTSKSIRYSRDCILTHVSPACSGRLDSRRCLELCAPCTW
jgi:eukaryotic-like serine/threonine-protein kinase